MNPIPPTRALIDRLVNESGAADAEAAIRKSARSLIDQYHTLFTEMSMPLNMEALASMRGITKSDLPPVHSDDAELGPDGQGGMEYRVNPDRPETRQRFSVAHEITHTFFPDYQAKTWCRTDGKYRRRDNPDEFVEMLCDIGASELLMPLAWFSTDIQTVGTAEQLLALVRTYHASREAVLRRFAEVHPRAVAAVFFSWKLKPVEYGTVGRLNQQNLLGLDPMEEARQAKKLRIDYTIPSGAFRQAGHFLPEDKSVVNDGPLYTAAASGRGCEEEWDLALGQAAGRYRIIALPVWTPVGERGPKGENAVAAIMEPLSVSRPKKKARQDAHPSLF
jgi:hypothetical protein